MKRLLELVKKLLGNRDKATAASRPRSRKRNVTGKGKGVNIHK